MVNNSKSDFNRNYTEDDFVLISGLQHLVFCERQWGLIHLEGIWEENRLTAEGRLLHKQADEERIEIFGDSVISRGLYIRSLRFGLYGKSDVVEFHRVRKPDAEGSECRIPGFDGLWRPLPVEYKRGRPKPDVCDEIQLCAQAFCLEEMLNVKIHVGAIFYGKPRRRFNVQFDACLREETESAIGKLHQLTQAGITPGPVNDSRCLRCSLKDICLPKATSGKSVGRYVSRMKASSLKDMI